MRWMQAWLLGAALLVTGCGGSNGDAQSSANNATPLPTSVYASAAPQGEVQTVEAVRANISEGSEVILRGVVGGRKDPITQNRAVVTIVDDTLEKSCGAPDDHCPTPWDYCCTLPETLAANMATVRFVDEQGNLLPATVGADGRIKPMSTIVVRGKVASGSTADNLIVDVVEVFVEKI